MRPRFDTAHNRAYSALAEFTPSEVFFMFRSFIIAALIVLFAGCAAAQAAIWDVSVPDSSGWDAGDCSLAVDSSNFPWVSFSSFGSLYVTTEPGPDDWLGVDEYVASVGYEAYASLAMTPGGQPALAFIDGSDGVSYYLKYTYKSSGSWTSPETVDTVGSDSAGAQPDFVSLAFNPRSGEACIAYCKLVSSVNYVCFAARKSESSWNTPRSIDSVGSIATAPFLAIDSAGTAYVSFADSSGQLKLRTAANPDSGGWQVVTIDGTGTSPVVGYTSVALQPNGLPGNRLLSAQLGHHPLKYASKTGGSWSTEIASQTGEYGYCSLAFTPPGTFTPDGMPVIAYDDSSGMMSEAGKLGTGWYTRSIGIRGPTRGPRL